MQPSRHEGYCITLAEARAFVTTNFVGAMEQIENGQDGFITEFDEDRIQKAIEKLIKDELLRNKFTDNLRRKNVNTTSEISKLIKCTG